MKEERQAMLDGRAPLSDSKEVNPGPPDSPGAAIRTGIIVAFSLLIVIVVLYVVAFSLLWTFRAPFVSIPPQGNLSTGVIAQFNRACLTSACPVLGGGFFFGLATAPAHVEDQLDDSWLDFARMGTVCANPENSMDLPAALRKQGAERVRAWSNTPLAEERLRFWTEPEVEMGLAAGTGADALRMGVDWGRIVPTEPRDGAMEVDWAAVQRYKEMLQLARHRYGLRVMLTLFHHSMPKWAIPHGGWTNSSTVAHFLQFAELAASEFGLLVDSWVTFNEPTLFCLLTHCVGVWPPGFKASPLHIGTCFTPVGQYGTAMANVARAHRGAYDVIRARSRAPIGVAHNTAFVTPYSVLDLAAQQYMDSMTLVRWIDDIHTRLDFLGLNYYGQELVSVAGLQEVREEEYSEAGRAVYPDGLYHLLVAFHARYKEKHPGLRYIITENGMADETDVICGPYLVEHLLAVHAAIREGVPVDGYFHWTVSDNWEWADGYCPKFGLVAVDRARNLSRTPRPSYHLYSRIVSSRVITAEQREHEWSVLQAAVREGRKRPFCRAVDSMGRMGSVPLDVPTWRNISGLDWRFGRYQAPGLRTMFSRAAHVLRCWADDVATMVTGRAGLM